MELRISITPKMEQQLRAVASFNASKPTPTAIFGLEKWLDQQSKRPEIIAWSIKSATRTKKGKA